MLRYCNVNSSGVLHSKHAQAASPPYGRATLAGRTVGRVGCPRLIRPVNLHAAQQVRPDLVLRVATARVRLAVQLPLRPCASSTSALGDGQPHGLPDAAGAPASAPRQRETPCAIRRSVASVTDPLHSPAAAGNTRSISPRRRDGPAAKSAKRAYGRSFLCAQQSRLVERAA
ncbi:hypothetical protein X980_6041 [Burkholderia pseudomallei MSHR4000]|nr:hypothetical protein X980_6041 [Burkholderia pseudomallei MSHR4000]KGW80500.1 hypothetical protein Y048_6035 [Burkholderia pseudomallei MSHR456]